MPKKIRPLKVLLTDFYLHNPTEIQRFADVSYGKARQIFEKAWEKDKEILGEVITDYVRRKTVMKLLGISEQDIIEKMWVLEHPQKR